MWLNKLEEKFGDRKYITTIIQFTGIESVSDPSRASLEISNIFTDRTRDEFDLCNICIVILLLDRKLIRAGMGNIPIQYVLSDRSFRNDRWSVLNLCDSYVCVWRILWCFCEYGHILSEYDIVFSICSNVSRDGSVSVHDPSNQGKMAWILRRIIFNLHFFKFRLYSCRNFG